MHTVCETHRARARPGKLRDQKQILDGSYSEEHRDLGRAKLSRTESDSSKIGAQLCQRLWATGVDIIGKHKPASLPIETRRHLDLTEAIHREYAGASVTTVRAEAEAQAFAPLPVKTASSKSPSRPSIEPTYIGLHPIISGSQIPGRVARRRQAQASPATNILQHAPTSSGGPAPALYVSRSAQHLLKLRLTGLPSGPCAPLHRCATT